MVAASLYLGFCASIVWVGQVTVLFSHELCLASIVPCESIGLIYLCFTLQGTYLTSAALSHARDNNLPEGLTLGKFTGEFWGLFASTQVQF